jgi:cytochrome c556
MSRKWIGFAVAATLVVASSVATSFSRAQDEPKHKEDDKDAPPLRKIMEKVQKINLSLGKATRNAASFKKSQQEVGKMAKDLAKLAKDSKPHKEAYLKNAKDETDPKKRVEKWDEIMDAFAKTSDYLASAAGKQGSDQKKVKDLFQDVKKTCADCHTVFRVESEF